MDKKKLADRIGKNILHYRKSCGLSQKQLAEKAILSTAFLSKVEHGEKLPSVAAILEIADALHVSCDALMCEMTGEVIIRNIQSLLMNESPSSLVKIERVIRVLTEGPK